MEENDTPTDAKDIPREFIQVGKKLWKSRPKNILTILKYNVPVLNFPIFGEIFNSFFISLNNYYEKKRFIKMLDTISEEIRLIDQEKIDRVFENRRILLFFLEEP